MRLRKDVNVFLYDPSSKFFHVVVELKNIPGALNGVLGVLGRLNLNVLGSFSSADNSASVGMWSGFVKDSQLSACELKKTLAASEYVIDSMVVESKDGFLVDSVHFPLSWNSGDRGFMGRARYFARMLRSVRDEFGTGGEKIIYDEGYAWGRETYQEMTSRLAPEFVQANLGELLKFYQALGWFRVEGVDRKEGGRVEVRTSENFECMAAEAAGPYSHFIRGHLSGAVTAILKADMDCQEAKCVAAGDEYCEFVLSPRGREGRRVGQLAMATVP